MISFKQYLRETISKSLDEGGQFGHMQAPFEVDSFKFDDLIDIIKQSLNGKLEKVAEKTDGQGLMFSVHNNKVVFSRNKSQTSNFGANGLSAIKMGDMFAGRGELGDGFKFAAQDIEAAVDKLSKKQKSEIFDDGRHWMSSEILFAKNPNVIEYGTNAIFFHGTIEHDIKGNAIAKMNKDTATTFSKALKKISVNTQRTFELSDIEAIVTTELPNWKSLLSGYKGQLAKLAKDAGVSANATMYEYRAAMWMKEIESLFPDESDEVKNLIKLRWVDSIKSPNVKALADMMNDPDTFRATDKKLVPIKNKILNPISLIFLRVGADVLGGLSAWMAVNPEKSIVKMKKNFDSAVAKIRASSDIALIDRLNVELARIDDIGGIDKLVPTEGIAFFHKGKLIKMTGLFAPLNQLQSLLWKLPESK